MMSGGYLGGRRQARRAVWQNQRRRQSTVGGLTPGMVLWLLCALPVVLPAMGIMKLGQSWGYGKKASFLVGVFVILGVLEVVGIMVG